MFYTADQLSNMSMEELEKIHKRMKIPTQEQKQKAWKKMDIGIYDDKGNLIGDLAELQEYKFSMYDLYGIPYGMLDGEQDNEGNIAEKERDYDKARILIMQGKDLPEDLKQRLLKYKGE